MLFAPLACSGVTVVLCSFCNCARLKYLIGAKEMGDTIPIRVLVRVRPFSTREKDESAKPTVRCFESQSISVGDKYFSFDGVLDELCSQEEAYDSSGASLIDKLFGGYNCSILAYGQTGSGKTFTMGTEETTATMLSEGRGIVPRIVDRIFDNIRQMPSPQLFTVRVSMFEVYDDKVLDLLSRQPSKEGLPIREKNGMPYVQGLSQHDVSSLTTTMSQLEKGCSLRSKGETAMNASSSRSHAVFTIEVEKTAADDEDSSYTSRMRLVDLAGSERLKKTLAEGARKMEGIKINEGLSALGKVIQALAAGESHIPYRDSKITRLLQDSLGGNSYTVMIACVSPADVNADETISTLRYADRVKSIKNKPTVQMDPTTAKIRSLLDENDKLRREVAAYRAGESPEEIVDLGETAGKATTVPPVFSLASGVVPKTPVARALCMDSTFMGTPQRLAPRRELEDAKAELAKRDAAICDLRDRLKDVIMKKAKLESEALKADTENERLLEVLERKRKLIDDMVAATEEGDDLQATICTLFTEEKKREEAETVDAEDDLLDNTQNDDDSVNASEEELDRLMANTEAYSRELEDLLKQIQDREKQMQHNESTLKQLAKKDEENKREKEELERMIASLTKSKDDLDQQIKKLGKSAKISEERRQKLVEVEGELNARKKKLKELAGLARMKQQSDEAVKRLKGEIQEMKQLRVRTTKLLKAESDKYRLFKVAADKKICQMVMKDRKRDADAAKKEQTLSQQLKVTKIKLDESTAANRRLQAQLMKASNGRDERENNEKNNEQWKNFIEDELSLVASANEVFARCQNLMLERTKLVVHQSALNSRIATLQKKLEPALKKRQTLTGDVEEDESTLERLLLEQSDLQLSINRVSLQIADLNNNANSEQLNELEGKRWSTVHTVAAAKVALKQLFNIATNDRRALGDEKSSREDEKATHDVALEKERCKAKEASDELQQFKQEERNRNNQVLDSIMADKGEFTAQLQHLIAAILLQDDKMTEDQLTAIKDLDEKLKLFDLGRSAMKKAQKQTTRKALKSLSENAILDGPRDAKPLRRQQNELDTLTAVAGDDDESCRDEDPNDRTYDTRGAKRKTRSVAPRRNVRALLKMPSPIKPLQEEEGENTMRTRRNPFFCKSGSSTSNTTFDVHQPVSENEGESGPSTPVDTTYICSPHQSSEDFLQAGLKLVKPSDRSLGPLK